MFTVYTLASQKGIWMAMSHLKVTVAINKDFEYNFKGADYVSNLHFYV